MQTGLLWVDSMKDIYENLVAIENKIRNLVNENQDLNAQNQELAEKQARLMEIIDNQKNNISELEEKNKLLKITKSIETGKGAVDAKLRINELVRELDKCIGLLNK